MSYIPDVAVMRIYRLAIVDPWIAFVKQFFFQFFFRPPPRVATDLVVGPVAGFQPQLGWRYGQGNGHQTHQSC